MSVGLQRLREDAAAVRKGRSTRARTPRSSMPRWRPMRAGASCWPRAIGSRPSETAASKAIGEAIRGGAAPNGPETAVLRARSTEAGGRIAAIDAELADGRGDRR